MKTHVLGIVCPSFQGSTILDVLLNTHPLATGIGEIYHLVDRWWEKTTTRGIRAICWCGKESECPVFPTSEAPFPLAGIHRRVTDTMGTPWVVDSSKFFKYFETAEEANTADSYSYVVLIKRPGPAIGSFLKHHPEWTPEKAVEIWCNWYMWLRDFLASRRYMILPYDEFTEEPTLALWRIVRMMNAADPDLEVAYDFDIGNYLDTSKHPMHRFAGNTKVVKIGERPILPDETWRDHFRATPEIRKMWDTYYATLELRGRGFTWG